MTFSNALSGIDAASLTRNATKIPSWGGYVYKTTTGMSDEDIAAGKFQLRFVKKNGDQYVFTWDGVADYTYTGYIVHGDDAALGTGDPVVGTKLIHDADLLEAYASDAWEYGAQSTYDERRTGPGEW